MNPNDADQAAADILAVLARYDPPNGSQIPELATPQLAQLRGAALSTDQLKNLQPPTWLIEGVLQHDSLAEVYGKPGSFKSFLAQAWAMHLTTGLKWAGLAVEPCPVVYVVSEGAHGVGKRLTAWEQANHHATPNPGEWAPVHWLPLTIGLGNAVWGDALGSYAAEQGAGLVVIDTRARNTVGLDENTSRDMGLVVANIERTRSISKACILLVHHSNAAGDKSRGSTAVEGAVDTEISVKKAEGLVTVKLEKQKNGPDGTEWQLKVVPGSDSVTLEPMADAPKVVTDSGRAIYTALLEVWHGEGISYTRWRDCCDEVSPKTFARQVKALVEQGWVAKEGRSYAPGDPEMVS